MCSKCVRVRTAKMCDKACGTLTYASDKELSVSGARLCGFDVTFVLCLCSQCIGFLACFGITGVQTHVSMGVTCLLKSFAVPAKRTENNQSLLAVCPRSRNYLSYWI